MKKLLVATISFTALAVSTATTADICEHGHRNADEADNKAELIAQENDLQLLELLDKQRENEDKEEPDHSSYN